MNDEELNINFTNQQNVDISTQHLSKLTYKCPYCTTSNLVSYQQRNRLFKEHKGLLCHYCHKAFSLEGRKTVFEETQITYLQNEFKRFMDKRKKDTK